MNERTSMLHSHILYRTYILVGQSVLGLFYILLLVQGWLSCFQNICVHFQFSMSAGVAIGAAWQTDRQTAGFLIAK